MKRLFEIIAFCFITTEIFAVWTPGKNQGTTLSEYPVEMCQDTTGYKNLLNVDLFNLPVIPPSCGVQFYKDGIIYLAKTRNEDKMLPQFVSFGTSEAYYSVSYDMTTGKQTLFSPSFSFSYPCEAITFNSDNSVMYFTKYLKKDKREKIYMATLITSDTRQSGWKFEKAPLFFCKENSTYSHPALSADGEIMVFASDCEGTKGGMDLFISKREGDKWSEPVNAGNLINTAGDEFYPFIDSDKNLFYSSDSLPGFGGFDIFTCKYNGESWEKPVNLSSHINSEYDDIAFTINKSDGRTAFYTRRDNIDKEKMQLFRIVLNPEVYDRNLSTIPYIFNGKPVLRPILLTEEKEEKLPPPETDTLTSKPVTVIMLPVVLPEKEIEKKKEETKVAEAKVVTIIPTIPLTDEQKDVVIYRIQFLSSPKSKLNDQIVIDGKSYQTYEYYYLGEYRYTIGEFRTLDPAIELQSACRKAGYAQAFVAAFKNNTRSLDLKLFK